jgi:1,4-alpha-glucan branching enzyme
MNIEFSEEVEPENLVGLLNGKSRADMALARNIANTPYTYFEGTANRYITQQRCQNRRNAAGQLVRQCVNVQVENPRYRQSQQEAKRLALYRYTNEIDRTLERLRMIKESNNSLTAVQRADLDTQITQLQMEASSLQSQRGGFRF